MKIKHDYLKVLENAFCNGKTNELKSILSPNCKYYSEYSEKRITGKDEIASHIGNVFLESNTNNRYFGLLKIRDNILKKPNNVVNTNDDVLVIYGFGNSNFPLFVVDIDINNNNEITSILLSRDGKKYNLNFYSEEIEEDAIDDLPNTIKSESREDIWRNNTCKMFSFQDFSSPSQNQYYIWVEADKAFRNFLKNNDYYISEVNVFDDCVGYKTRRLGTNYTIYMYAYGKKKTSLLDGDYCSKLRDMEFSKDSEILIAYLHVKKYYLGENKGYWVNGYSDGNIELWKLAELNNKNILLYYPRKEMFEIQDKLLYAVNHEDLDLFDSIVLSTVNIAGPGNYQGKFIKEKLVELHRSHGDMVYCYIRKNDVIYSKTLFFKNYGYFGFIVNPEKHDLIEQVYFEKDNHKKLEEFVIVENEENEYKNTIPKLNRVEVFEPELTERFALKLIYDDGIVKKYVLPIDEEYEKDEVVKYDFHSFTNEIWKTAKIVSNRNINDKHLNVFSKTGEGVEFVNGYSISKNILYENSRLYTEPTILNKIIYRDSKLTATKVWHWDARAAYFNDYDDESIIKVLLTGHAFNYYGTSTYASSNGKRLTHLDFEIIEDFKNRASLVYPYGTKYAIIDRKMNFITEPIYDDADLNYNDELIRESEEDLPDTFKVKKNDKWMFVDSNGKEIDPCKYTNYEDVSRYSEGLCRVSTMKLGFMDVAYHTDYEHIMGYWGYVNENGEEIIKPQFIYANDFENGIAIAAKGEWTKSEKWNNKYNTGRYWTENELWGAIDKEGKEVIPFIYDEITTFWDVNDVFKAHYGGWENGAWGVIDKNGNWLAEPKFSKIDYEYYDGLFAFDGTNSNPEDQMSDIPMGIYDCKQGKVIYEPRFNDVSFTDDGYIEVEEYDDSLGRTVKRIYDRVGNKILDTPYSSIYSLKDGYREAHIWNSENKSNTVGFLDKDFKEVIPCKYDIWRSYSIKKNRYVYRENNLCGIKDFDGNIIIPAMYFDIQDKIDSDYFIAEVGEKDNKKEILIDINNHVILGPENRYSAIHLSKDRKTALCHGEKGCDLIRIVKNTDDN